MGEDSYVRSRGVAHYEADWKKLHRYRLSAFSDHHDFGGLNQRHRGASDAKAQLVQSIPGDDGRDLVRADIQIHLSQDRIAFDGRDYSYQLVPATDIFSLRFFAQPSIQKRFLEAVPTADLRPLYFSFPHVAVKGRQPQPQVARGLPRGEDPVMLVVL